MKFQRLEFRPGFIKKFAEEFVVLKPDYLNRDNHSLKNNNNRISHDKNKNSTYRTAFFAHKGNDKAKNGMRQSERPDTDKTYCAGKIA